MSKFVKSIGLAAALVSIMPAYAFYRCQTPDGASFQDTPCAQAAGESYMQPTGRHALAYAGNGRPDPQSHPSHLREGRRAHPARSAERNAP